jgi:polar amino acid transport system substrate-binding protein
MKLPSFVNRCLATLAILCLAGVSLRAQSTLTLRADSWYPFNGEPEAANPGYVVEILKAVFGKENLKIDYQIMPWKRAVADCQSGAIDGVIGALKSDAPDLVFPDEPMSISSQVFYVKKGSDWKFTGIDSLRGKRLGVINGYSYSEKMDAYVKANEKDASLIDLAAGDTPVEQCVKKLKAGRIDCYLEVEPVFLAAVPKYGMASDDFVSAGPLAEPDPFFVAFTPKKPEAKKWAQIWTDGLKELRKSGKLAEILAKYNLKDWEQTKPAK